MLSISYENRVYEDKKKSKVKSKKWRDVNI